MPKNLPKKNDEFVSINEASRILNVSEKTLRRWEEKHILFPLRTLGKHRRYSLSQIYTFKRKKGKKRIRYSFDKFEKSSQAEILFRKPLIGPSIEEKTMEVIPAIYKSLPKVQKKAIVLASLLFLTLSLALIGQKRFLAKLIPSSESSSVFPLVKKDKENEAFKSLKRFSESQKEEVLAASTFQNISFNVNVDSVFKENTTIEGILAVDSGKIVSSASTFNLVNETATTLNIGGAATSLNLAAGTGTTTIGNTLNLAGNRLISEGDLLVDPGGGGVSVGTGTAGSIDLTGNDLYITGDLEVDGSAYIPTLVIGSDTITDITGTGLQVSSGSLQTTLGTSIESGEIADDTIKEIDLSVSNSPTNAYLLSYNSSTGGFTWTTDSWTDSGTTVYLTDTTDELVLGGTSTLSSAKFSIDGDTDQIQLFIQGNSTQTSNLAVFENSGGTDLITIGNTGILTISDGGFLDLSNIVHDDSSPQGLKLPQSGSLTNLSSGMGYLAFDTSDQRVKVYNGTTWSDISGASTSLQEAYSNDVNGSDTIIALDSSDDSLIFRNPASGGTDSSYVLTLDQLATGATDALRISNAGTGTLITTDAAGSGTTADAILIRQTSSGTITDAIDVSDETITNALNVGANTITGTTYTLSGTSAVIDFSNFDLATTGHITVQGGYGIDTSAAGTLALGDTTATTINLGSTVTTTLNIGAGGALTRAINIGTGTGADTINIGTGGTGADVIAIGGGVGTLDINTGDWDISTSGDLSGIGAITADGAINFNPATTGDINFTVTSGDTSYLNISGLTSGSGSALCLDGSNNLVTCTVGLGGISGSGTAGQIAYFDTTTSITSETSGFTWDATNNKLGIGIDSPTSKFHLTGAVVGKALSIFDETGDQNILTASASGTTQFNLTRTGTIETGDLTLGLDDASATLSTQDTNEDLTFDPNGTGAIILTATTGVNITSTGLVSDLDGNLVLDDQIDIGSTTTGVRVTTTGSISDIDGTLQLNDTVDVTGTISDSDSNLILDDTVDIGSTTTGLRVDTAGSVIDIDGNIILNDTVDLGSATTGVRIATTGVIIDIDGDLVLDDQLNLGSATTGLLLTTDGVITDIDDASISLGEDVSVSGSITTTGDIAVNGADITSTATSFNLLDSTVTTLNIGAAATAWDIGASSGTGTINNAVLAITGVIDANGTGTHDIAGTLNLSGSGTQLTASNDLLINSVGSNIATDDRVTIGTTTVGVGQLNVSGTQIGKALVILNETGTDQNILTASASGTTVLQLSRAGNITLFSGTANADNLRISPNTTGASAYTGTITSADISADRSWTFPNTDGAVCLSSGNCSGSAGGSKWTDGGTFTYLTETADDLIVGGSVVPTSDAKLSFQGDEDEIQVAIIGNSSQTNYLFLLENSAGTDLSWFDESGNLRIGGTAPDTGKLNVTGAFVGKALAIFDETGDQDILSASASGTTALSLARSGNLTLYSTTATSDRLTLVPQSGGSNTFTGSITSSDLTADRSWTFPNDTGTVCLTTGNCAGVGGVGDITAVGSVGSGDAFSDSTADDDWLGLGAAAGRIEFDDLTYDEINIISAKLGLGTQIPTSLLHVSGTVTGKALTILDDTGTDQNILTASASGVTVFNLERDGDLSLRNSEVIGNSTDDIITFTGVGGSDNTDLYLDLDGTYPVLYSSTDTTVGINDALDVTGTISDSDSNLILDDTVDIGSATTGLRVDTAGSTLDIDGNLVLNDTVDIGSATTGIRVATTGSISDIDGTLQLNDTVDVTGTISDSDSNLILDDTVDIGSTTTGLRVDTAGSVIDIDGNIILNDTVDLGSATTGVRIATTGVIIDIDGDLVLDDQLNLGSATTGLLLTTDATISDIDDTAVSIDDDISFVGAQAILTTTGDLTLNPGDEVILGDTDTLIIGGHAGDVAYNVISDSGGSATYASTDDDLYIEDILEVGGSFYIGGNPLSSSSLWANTLNVYHPYGPYAGVADLAIGGTATSSAKFHVNATTGAITADSIVLGNNTTDITTTADENLTLVAYGTGIIELNDSVTSYGSLIFNAVANDITTASGEDLTLYGTGGGVINLNDSITAGGTLTLSSVATDITTGTDEDLTLIANGLGTVIVNDGLLVTGTISDSDSNLILDDTVDIGSTTTGLRVDTAGSVIDIDATAVSFDDDISFTGAQAILTTTGDLTLNPGDEVILGDTDTLIIGGHAGDVAYNVISDSGGSPTSGQIASDDDLYVEGVIEASSLYQGANQVCDASGNCAGTTNYWEVSSNSISPGNAAADTDRVVIGGNDTTVFQFEVNGTQPGKALVSLNDTGTDQNILTASASGTTVANLDRSGNLAIEGQLSDLSTATLTINDALSVLGAVTVTGVVSDSDSNLILDDTVDIGSTTTGLRVDTAGSVIDIDATAVSFDDDISFTGAQAILTTTGDLSLTPAGNLVINTTGGTVDIDDATISLATQATDLDIIDNSTTALTISESTNNYLTVNTDNTNTAVTLDLPVAGATSTTGNLFTSNVTKTINLGSGTAADSINIGTGGTTADTITFGNTGVATTFTFNSGATTTNPMTLDFNTLTTGTGVDLSLDGITTGTGLLIDDATAAGLSSGTLLQVQSVTTDTTAITDGLLGYFDWSPGSSTTKTGDLFRINIGSSGNVTNLLNITDNSSTLFRVAETQIESAVPHAFTSAGDVTVAYDLIFSNQTASQIESYGPLSLVAGESFESNNLTLKTYGTGDIVFDNDGSTTSILTDEGRLGLGTASPIGMLHVDTSNTATFGKAAVIINHDESQDLLTASASGTTRFYVTTAGVTWTGLSNTTSSTAVCSSLANSTDPTSGTPYELRDCDVAPAVDYAESYPTANDVDYADIVATSDEIVETRMDDGYGNLLGEEYKRYVSKLVKSSNQYQANIIGIVSKNYGDFTSTGYRTVEPKDHPMPVALSGRVPVKIVQSSDPIHSGDFLTTSDQPGRAMKATQSGRIIGTALEAWTTDSGKEQIMVFVNNTYHIANNSLSPTGDIKLAQDPENQGFYQLKDKEGNLIDKLSGFTSFVSENVKAGFAEITDLVATSVVTTSVKTAEISPLIRSDLIIDLENGGTGDSGFGKLLVKGKDDKVVAEIDSQGNSTFAGELTTDKLITSEVVSDKLEVRSGASIAGELRAEKIYANEIVGLDAKFANAATNSLTGITREEIENLLKDVETDQQLLSQTSTWEFDTSTGSAALNELALENLYVTNKAAINSLSVTQSIVVGSDLVINITSEVIAGTSIDTLNAPLSIQSSASQPLYIMAGLVQIDTQGNLQIAGDLAVGGSITSSGLVLQAENTSEVSGNFTSEVESGFGKLLSLINAQGEEVAQISASGSARFASVEIGKITLSNDPEATSSATFEGVVYETSASAGSAKLSSGSIQVIIKNPKVTPNSLIFITPTSETSQTIFVKEQKEGEFVVGLSQVESFDISFNWWIIQLAKQAGI